MRKYIPVNLEPRNCPNCGSRFQPSRRTHTFCSEKCRDGNLGAKERKNAARRLATAKDPAARRRINMANALKKYGLTYDDYHRMLIEQSGRCYICGQPPKPDGNRSASRLHVDHCHDSGKVRHLLCTLCNLGLGYFRHDQNILANAINYLEGE